MFSKLGLSPVIATVGLVLITLTAAVIIAGFIVPFVRDNLGESSQCFDYKDYFILEEEFGYNCYNSTDQEYLISVGATSGRNELDDGVRGLEIILSGSGQSRIINIEKDGAVSGGTIESIGDSIEVPESGELYSYRYASTEDYQRVNVRPVLSSGVQCDISDSIMIKDGC